MFAALVEDADPSELSALQVQRAAKAEQAAGLDRRIRRLKFARNALVAAVLAGVVALVLPHLGGSRAVTASSAYSAASSSAAGGAAGGGYASDLSQKKHATAPAAAQVPASLAAVSPASAAASSAAAAGPADTSAVTSGAAGPAGFSTAGAATNAGSVATAGAGVTQGPSPGSSSALAAALPSGSSASSSAGSAASGGAAAAGSTCVELPAGSPERALAELAGYSGTVTVVGCTKQTHAGAGSGALTFAVTRSIAGACGSAPRRCVPVPGQTSAYSLPGLVIVYSSGLAVEITERAPAPQRDALIASARTLLTSLR